MTRKSPDKLMFGREIRRKLLGRVVPQKEKRHDPIREKDDGKKWKAYGDERRHAQQSWIKIGDHVLLKQNRAEMLTPANDPRPYAVVGVKRSMFTGKSGKEIKSRNSSHCKVLKYAGKEEYDVWDLNEEQNQRTSMLKEGKSLEKEI